MPTTLLLWFSLTAIIKVVFRLALKTQFNLNSTKQRADKVSGAFSSKRMRHFSQEFVGSWNRTWRRWSHIQPQLHINDACHITDDMSMLCLQFVGLPPSGRKKIYFCRFTVNMMERRFPAVSYRCWQGGIREFNRASLLQLLKQLSAAAGKSFDKMQSWVINLFFVIYVHSYK